MLMIRKSQEKFIRLLALFIAILLPWVLGAIYLNKTNINEHTDSLIAVNFKKDTLPRVDHSKYRTLNKEFKTPQEVTGACLGCHNMTAQEVMQSSHWKWSREYVTGKGDTIQLGKKNIINNFCIGMTSNEARCTSCHIGFGWKDDNFDFADSRNIDCIVCHDQTGTYKKFPTDAGYPASEVKIFDGKTYQPPDYTLIAKNIGSPTNQNCGTCHFVGGGGNNVKHGDIANELNNVSKTVDVHMGTDGGDMDCVDCHKTERHNISGNLYSIASIDTNRVSCEACHSETPHSNKILEQHSSKIACQTCHIPSFARVSATKMYWDWSTAGQLNEDGSIRVEKDSMGNITYHSKKGSFQWETDVVPSYNWFNGKAQHYVLGDKFDPSQSVELNTLLGEYKDKNSKIIPVKVHEAKQIYDNVNNTMILPHLFGKDSSAYWKNFDWQKAAITGMKAAELDYSGSYDFIHTIMYWPVNHMVAPKEESLQCIDCHSRESRLADLTDFYLPGRDRSISLDFMGFAMIILSALGVVVHGLLRIFKKK